MKNREQIAREARTVNTPIPLAPTLNETFPSVESAARLDRLFSGVFTAGDRSFHESNVYFAYRVDVQPINFLAAGIAVVVLTLLCTGFQVVRASSADPAVTLRTE